MKTFWDVASLLCFAICGAGGGIASYNGEWSKAAAFYALCILFRRAI